MHADLVAQSFPCVCLAITTLKATTLTMDCVGVIVVQSQADPPGDAVTERPLLNDRPGMYTGQMATVMVA